MGIWCCSQAVPWNAHTLWVMSEFSRLLRQSHAAGGQQVLAGALGILLPTWETHMELQACLGLAQPWWLWTSGKGFLPISLLFHMKLK